MEFDTDQQKTRSYLIGVSVFILSIYYFDINIEQLSLFGIKLSNPEKKNNIWTALSLTCLYLEIRFLQLSGYKDAFYSALVVDEFKKTLIWLVMKGSAAKFKEHLMQDIIDSSDRSAPTPTIKVIKIDSRGTLSQIHSLLEREDYKKANESKKSKLTFDLMLSQNLNIVYSFTYQAMVGTNHVTSTGRILEVKVPRIVKEISLLLAIIKASITTRWFTDSGVPLLLGVAAGIIAYWKFCGYIQ